MPRPRRSLTGSGTPAELLDPDALLWISARSSTTWMLDHDVPLDGVSAASWAALHPLERHHQAARRWTIEQGHGSNFGGSSVQHPDLGWMGAAGIPCTFNRRLEESFATAGVQTEQPGSPPRR